MIPLPTIRASNQLTAMVLGYFAFTAIYLVTGIFHLRPPQVLTGGALDAAIPFVAGTVWIYLTQFLMVPCAIMCARDDADRSHAFYAMLLATLLAAPVFLAWPTQIVRQTITGEGATAIVWSLLYRADTPANCFPSLHVALALIAGNALRRRGWLAVAVMWPTLIALSTLTTKQHIVLDVAGGIVLAAIAWTLTPKLLRHENTIRADDFARP